LKHKGTQTAGETHIPREEKGRFGTLCNTTASRLSAFVISRSSARIRKAAPKREITDAAVASVFIGFVKTKNEPFSMDDLGEKRPPVIRAALVHFIN
jgi:hypothetical protein